MSPESFRALLVRADGSSCLLWPGARSEKGYGRVLVGSRKVRAHRLAWQFEHGEAPPAGLVVMHSCDVLACCNPAHLSVGTVADNNRDMAAKGRAKFFGYRFVGAVPKLLAFVAAQTQDGESWAVTGREGADALDWPRRTFTWAAGVLRDKGLVSYVKSGPLFVFSAPAVAS